MKKKVAHTAATLDSPLSSSPINPKILTFIFDARAHTKILYSQANDVMRWSVVEEISNDQNTFSSPHQGG